MELLLLSNPGRRVSRCSRMRPRALVEFVAGRRVTFLPYALADHAEYVRTVAEALGNTTSK